MSTSDAVCESEPSKDEQFENKRTLNSETAEKLNCFFGRFATFPIALLLLDYDGTLAPFRVDRFQAKPWAGVRDLLNHIQNQKKTRIVVISGRPAGEIVPLINLDTPPEVWGLHGAERLYPDGRRELETIERPARAALENLCARLRQNAFGGLFEEKPNAAVMHWRGIAPEKASEIERRIRALFEPLTQIEGLTLLQFECGLELRAGRDKGGAVKAILDEISTGEQERFPAAYLGDDFTDEMAFAALKGHGLSVLVRRELRETVADIWLKPPEELRQFLVRWREACSETSAV